MSLLAPSELCFDGFRPAHEEPVDPVNRTERVGKDGLRFGIRPFLLE